MRRRTCHLDSLRLHQHSSSQHIVSALRQLRDSTSAPHSLLVYELQSPRRWSAVVTAVPLCVACGGWRWLAVSAMVGCARRYSAVPPRCSAVLGGARRWSAVWLAVLGGAQRCSAVSRQWSAVVGGGRRCSAVVSGGERWSAARAPLSAVVGGGQCAVLSGGGDSGGGPHGGGGLGKALRAPPAAF